MDEFTTSVLATMVGLPIGLGVGVLLALLVLNPIADWFTRTTWRIQRRRENRREDRLDQGRLLDNEVVREELEESPAWWDRQYQALAKKQLPRDAAAHEGHDLEELIQFWGGGYAGKRYCHDCGVTIERPPDG